MHRDATIAPVRISTQDRKLRLWKQPSVQLGGPDWEAPGPVEILMVAGVGNAGQSGPAGILVSGASLAARATKSSSSAISEGLSLHPQNGDQPRKTHQALVFT